MKDSKTHTSQRSPRVKNLASPDVLDSTSLTLATTQETNSDSFQPSATPANSEKVIKSRIFYAPQSTFTRSSAVAQTKAQQANSADETWCVPPITFWGDGTVHTEASTPPVPRALHSSASPINTALELALKSSKGSPAGSETHHKATKRSYRGYIRTASTMPLSPDFSTGGPNSAVGMMGAGRTSMVDDGSQNFHEDTARNAKFAITWTIIIILFEVLLVCHARWPHRFKLPEKLKGLSQGKKTSREHGRNSTKEYQIELKNQESDGSQVRNHAPHFNSSTNFGDSPGRI